MHKFCQIYEQVSSIHPKQRYKASMVLFPDVYQIGNYEHVDGEKVGKICEKYINSEIASALPLAKAMGAKVTCHLNQKVTHILCEIKCDSLKWHPMISMNTFINHESGFNLHQRLIKMSLIVTIDIILVSAGWIRQRWR